jgi:uncharacterized repeat protein (TIGR03803 family)
MRLSSLPRLLAFAVLALFVLGIMLATAGVSFAATENILYSFDSLARGSQPNGALTADSAGNLYGGTFYGGSNGDGLVFKLAPNSSGGWAETVLYNFGPSPHPSAPSGPFIFDAAGNLYGTSAMGGKDGLGTVFELSPNADGSWTEHTLYAFAGKTDGSVPNGGLVFDQAGNLYGTTSNGGGLGRNLCIDEGCGVVFKLTPGSGGKWTESAIFAFDGEGDGSMPVGGLVIDAAGNLYGATTHGGQGTGEGDGVVFELTASSGGWIETVLHTFTGPDGANPSGGLVFDGSGNLYGGASAGGIGTGCRGVPCGAIYELTPSGNSWNESVIYSFQGGNDGQEPSGNLAIDQSGNLYGTTYIGGTPSLGTVFKLTPSANGQWTET